MTKPTFKLGDVVRLKSGSPAMTISEEHGDGWFDVSWFDTSGVRCLHFYHGDCLEISAVEHTMTIEEWEKKAAPVFHWPR